MKRMQLMTGYKRGDVVLVRFIFSDETGERQRPAVIVSSDAYHQSRQEAIIAAITSRTDRILVGDHLISDWQEAGLLFPSVATGIVRTIKQGMTAKKLGIMPLPDMKRIEGNLRDALGLK
jgi:mRNA interferase MazF